MVKKQGMDFHPRDPHFDGENEGPISDPGMTSPQMGIRIDADPEGKMNPNPFHLTGEPNEDMKEFAKLTKGKEINKFKK